MSKDNQERLARQWAESTLSIATASAHACAAANHILATTKEPTMADVDWDHDKHYLAGAVDAYGSEVIMHSRVDDCEIATIRPGDETHGGRNWDTDLIPNGKKYELCEVTPEPSHPEVLRTLEDYENAPTGTVVAGKGYSAYTKKTPDDWSHTFSVTRLSESVEVIPRQVLRWGWGK